jgi:hypothetical protein
MQANPGFMADYELKVRRKNAEQRIRGLMETLATAYQSAAVLHRTIAELEECKAIDGASAEHMDAADICEEVVADLTGNCLPDMLRAARGEPPAAEPTQQ